MRRDVISQAFTISSFDVLLSIVGHSYSNQPLNVSHMPWHLTYWKPNLLFVCSVASVEHPSFLSIYQKENIGPTHMMQMWLGNYALTPKCVTAPKTRLFYGLTQTAHIWYWLHNLEIKKIQWFTFNPFKTLIDLFNWNYWNYSGDSSKLFPYIFTPHSIIISLLRFIQMLYKLIQIE